MDMFLSESLCICDSKRELISLFNRPMIQRKLEVLSEALNGHEDVLERIDAAAADTQCVS